MANPGKTVQETPAYYADAVHQAGVRFRHFNNQNAWEGEKYSYTVAYKFEDNGDVLFAVTRLGYGDQFCYKTGRAWAATRLLAASGSGRDTISVVRANPESPTALLLKSYRGTKEWGDALLLACYTAINLVERRWEMRARTRDKAKQEAVQA